MKNIACVLLMKRAQERKKQQQFNMAFCCICERVSDCFTWIVAFSYTCNMMITKRGEEVKKISCVFLMKRAQGYGNSICDICGTVVDDIYRSGGCVAHLWTAFLCYVWVGHSPLLTCTCGTCGLFMYIMLQRQSTVAAVQARRVHLLRLSAASAE